MIPTGPVKSDEPQAHRTAVVETEGASPAFSLAWIIFVLLGAADALIAMRVILKALAANPHVPFTGFIYQITNPLVWPFQGMFATRVASNGGVFEFSSLVAIGVYALLAWVVVRLATIPGRQQRRVTTRSSS
jgi:uncharacterized protein YggT (Ycf19 family)